MMMWPLVGLVQAVHVGDQGALAGAGGTDDAHKISLFHLKAHVIQRGDGIGHSRVIDITQVIYFDNASHRSEERRVGKECRL